VRGIVYDDGGEPVGGARVGLGDRLPRHVVRGARGPWVETTSDGRFELSGLSRAAGATVRAFHGAAGRGVVEVEPLWPDEEPEVEIVLDGGSGRRSRHFGLAVDVGGRGRRVTLTAVCPGSRAEAAGLRAGDAILAVDGAAPGSPAAAARALRGPRGTAVLVTVGRGDLSWTVLVERQLVTE
jgi:membrane-associated protease RseP (regulator of RpoE activity)